LDGNCLLSHEVSSVLHPDDIDTAPTRSKTGISRTNADFFIPHLLSSSSSVNEA
jgi:hypothetical protein